MRQKMFHQTWLFFFSLPPPYLGWNRTTSSSSSSLFIKRKTHNGARYIRNKLLKKQKKQQHREIENKKTKNKKWKEAISFLYSSFRFIKKASKREPQLSTGFPPFVIYMPSSNKSYCFKYDRLSNKPPKNESNKINKKKERKTKKRSQLFQRWQKRNHIHNGENKKQSGWVSAGVYIVLPVAQKRERRLFIF